MNQTVDYLKDLVGTKIKIIVNDKSRYNENFISDCKNLTFILEISQVTFFRGSIVTILRNNNIKNTVGYYEHIIKILPYRLIDNYCSYFKYDGLKFITI